MRSRRLDFRGRNPQFSWKNQYRDDDYDDAVKKPSPPTRSARPKAVVSRAQTNPQPTHSPHRRTESTTDRAQSSGSALEAAAESTHAATATSSASYTPGESDEDVTNSPLQTFEPSTWPSIVGLQEHRAGAHHPLPLSWTQEPVQSRFTLDAPLSDLRQSVGSDLPSPLRRFLATDPQIDAAEEDHHRMPRDFSDARMSIFDPLGLQLGSALGTTEPLLPPAEPSPVTATIQPDYTFPARYPPAPTPYSTSASAPHTYPTPTTAHSQQDSSATTGIVEFPPWWPHRNVKVRLCDKGTPLHQLLRELTAASNAASSPSAPPTRAFSPPTTLSPSNSISTSVNAAPSTWQ